LPWDAFVLLILIQLFIIIDIIILLIFKFTFLSIKVLVNGQLHHHQLHLYDQHYCPPPHQLLYSSVVSQRCWRPQHHVTHAPKVMENCLNSVFGSYLKMADAGQDMDKGSKVSLVLLDSIWDVLGLVVNWVDDHPHASVSEFWTHDIRVKVLVALWLGGRKHIQCCHLRW